MGDRIVLFLFDLIFHFIFIFFDSYMFSFVWWLLFMTGE